jgi:hypothetical protein
MKSVPQIREWVDVLALPLWILLFAYFFRKPNPTAEEKGFAAFAATGFLVDGYLSLCRFA